MGCKVNELPGLLANKELALGLWCSLVSPNAIETLATVPYEWFLLDMEHTTANLNDIVDQLRVLDASPIAGVVRPPCSDTVFIKRLLDAGAKNLLFPNIQSVQEAIQIIKATRYAPHGVRGVSVAGRAAEYGAQADYLQNAAKEIVIGIQLETKNALTLIPELASLPEISILFFGPGDLSADMGLLGQPDHPEVREAVISSIKEVVTHDKIAGVLAPNLEAANAYITAGAKFVAIGSDLLCLRTHANHLLEQIKSTE